MALLDPYANALEYRDATAKSDSSDDQSILAQLTGVSRMLERELGVCAGYFNAGAAASIRYFTPRVAGSRLLRLIDEEGRQHAFSAIAADGIAVDTDGDGDWDYTIDPTGETWVTPRPYNAAALSEPWKALELLDRSGASFSSWPTYPRSVRITGTPGWIAVPVTIKMLTIKMTRDERDSVEAGAAGSLSGVALKTDTWRLWLSAKAQYGNATMVFA